MCAKKAALLAAVVLAGSVSVARAGDGPLGSVSLPTAPVSLALTHDGIEAIAYFPSIVVSGAGSLDGTYAGWCADPNRWIQNGPAMLYSTYDPAAMAQVAALLDPPTTLFVDKLPIANYIVNRYVAGTTVITPFDTTCNPIPDMPNGIVNMWSIQQALWYFLTGRPLEDADSHAMSIICDATANGAAFVPACNQVVLILGLPVDAQGVGQSLLIQMPVPCGGGSATAWADGLDGRLFPGARQWGTYFEYELSCAP